MAAYFTAAQRSARRRAEKCGYLHGAAPREGHAGAAVAVAVHDAALGLQAHRRARGPQTDGDVDHGASRSAGISAAQRARMASVVAGSGVRSSAPSSAVPPSTTSLSRGTT